MGCRSTSPTVPTVCCVKIHGMSARIDDGLTRNQRWYRRHIETTREGSRQRTQDWRDSHPGANAEACRAYYAANAERLRERARRYYQEKRRVADKTPEGLLKDRMRKERRRAAMSGASSTLTTVEWLDICRAYGNLCAYCGQKLPLEQDHVIPLTRGGAHSKGNVVPACKPCNARKGNR